MVLGRRLIVPVLLSGAIAAWGALPTHAVSAAASARVRAETGVRQPQQIERAGKDGVSAPKAIREVKPRYTAEAQRRGVQGVVVVECTVLPDGTVESPRIVRSLDALYGLDEEALAAARQWRFEPATKDGVPVPASVTIELAFRLIGFEDPVPLRWPAAFPQNERSPGSAGEWADAVLEAGGVQVTFAYPTGWTLRTTGPAGNWFDLVSQDFPRLVVVSSPAASEAPSTPRRVVRDVQQRARSMAEAFEKNGSKATVHGTGQVEVGGRLWDWADYSALAGDRAIAPRFRSRAFGTTGRIRIWHFTATTGRHVLGVYLRVASAGPAESNARDERAAAEQLAALHARLSFQER
jgi:TonB family protein